MKMGSRLNTQGLIHLKAVIGLQINIHRDTHSRYAVILQPIHKALPIPYRSILIVLRQLRHFSFSNRNGSIEFVLHTDKGYWQHYAYQHRRSSDQSYKAGVFLYAAIRLFILIYCGGIILWKLGLRSWLAVIQGSIQLLHRAETPPWAHAHAIEQSLFLIFAHFYPHLAGQYQLILAEAIHRLGRLFAGKAVIHGGRQRVYVCP